MLLNDFLNEYDLDQEQLTLFLNNNADKYPVKRSLWNDLIIDDKYVDEIVREVKVQMEDERKRVENEKEQIRNEELQKSEIYSKILITSGFNFDGYRVIKYSGYISGDDVVQVDRGRDGIFQAATDVGEALMENLSIIRRNALINLKAQAHALGCNAIIGVDFDYLTLDPETVSITGNTLYMPYVFGVTANGNAVVIEKD